MSWSAWTAITKYQVLKQRKFVSLQSGSWKSEIRMPAWLSSGETPLPGLQEACVLTWRGSRGGVGREEGEKETEKREKCCKYCHIGD